MLLVFAAMPGLYGVKVRGDEIIWVDIVL
jgi:hypothetical protein